MKILHIKLTEEQHQLIKMGATTARMTMQDYAVRRLIPPQGYTEVGFIDPKDIEKIKVPGATVQVHTPPEKNNSEAKASNSTDGFVEAGRPLADESGELPCCKLPKPCKHWQWDGVEQAYVNSLSGRRITA